MFLRNKRTPIGIYPPRAMMFTGYYRPIRRSNNGDQATAVFAQGNSVNGGAYFGDGYQPNYLNSGPEPANEPEIPNAGTTASPQPKETLNKEAQGHRDQVHDQENQDQDHNEVHLLLIVINHKNLKSILFSRIIEMRILIYTPQHLLKNQLHRKQKQQLFPQKKLVLRKEKKYLDQQSKKKKKKMMMMKMKNMMMILMEELFLLYL